MTTPAPQFTNDDDAAQHWLIVLRDGDPDQKIQAREQLATVFERRGMLEEAADLLESNVRSGARGADIFRWLARLYKNQGDEVRAMQAAAEGAKYLPSATPLMATPDPGPVPSHRTANLKAGECPSCGNVARTKRMNCKRCGTALPSVAPSASTVGQQAGYIPQLVPQTVFSTAPGPTGPVAFETRVKNYSSPGAFNRDAGKMARDGWSVVSTTERQPRAGCLRIVTLGLFTLIFPPKPEIVVTYSRPRQR